MGLLVLKWGWLPWLGLYCVFLSRVYLFGGGTTCTPPPRRKKTRYLYNGDLFDRVFVLTYNFYLL